MSKPLFSTIALTLFPEMFPGPLGVSLAGKALEKGIWSLKSLDIRDFATDKHRTVDASPFGGGTGMVMKPDVIDSAVEAAKTELPGAKIIYPSPRGEKITQKLVETLKNQDLIILCGRFEGVDQRVIDHHDMLEVSLGDFVLSGGEIAALALLDTIVRLLPGVISKPEALDEESFSLNRIQVADSRSSQGKPRGAYTSVREHGEPQDIKPAPAQAGDASGKNEYDFAGLLEYPHYTRPSIWKDKAVPDVLLSGNHERIKAWRLEQARDITTARRPDLLKKE